MAAQKTRVLIVEEDAELARDLAASLERHSFDVSIAPAGEDAARRLHSYDPSLVLLNVPAGGNGSVETLQRIKQIKPELPIVLLSSLNNPELVFQASKLGADDCV